MNDEQAAYVIEVCQDVLAMLGAAGFTPDEMRLINEIAGDVQRSLDVVMARRLGGMGNLAAVRIIEAALAQSLKSVSAYRERFCEGH